MAAPVPQTRHRASDPARGLHLPVTFGAIGRLVMVLDIVLIVALSLGIGILTHVKLHDMWGDLQMLAGTGAYLALFFCAIMEFGRRYRPERIMEPLGAARDVVVAWTGTFALLLAFAFLMKMSGTLSRASILALFVGGLMVLLIVHLLAAAVITRVVSHGRLRGRRVLLVGDLKALIGEGALESLARNGYSIAEYVPVAEGLHVGPPAPDKVRGLAERIVAAARRHPVEEVLIAMPWRARASVQALMPQLAILPLPVSLLADPVLAGVLGRQQATIGDVRSVELQRAPMGLGERGAKRALDVVVASTALVLLSPVMLLAALAVKLETPGPVIFRQQRHGFGRRRFTIYKFRSMTVTEDGEAVRQATRGDARVTRVGRFIRRTSIDELPQLINVLKGDMSIVGPRPHALVHDHTYEAELDDYAFRHHVKPGLTGWAQVNGYRGETRDLDLMRARVDHDLWYIDNWSFWLDIAIIARTAVVLLFQRSAY
jgi:undecaprenyl-phosphate galactose phosphotransferase/putative colanic acid biosynthesis UDP-glucose lipid carrier transferase